MLFWHVASFIHNEYKLSIYVKTKATKSVQEIKVYHSHINRQISSYFNIIRREIYATFLFFHFFCLVAHTRSTSNDHIHHQIHALVATKLLNSFSLPGNSFFSIGFQAKSNLNHFAQETVSKNYRK